MNFEILVCRPNFSVITCLSLNLSPPSSLSPSGLTLLCLGLFCVAFTCILRFTFQNHPRSYPIIRGLPLCDDIPAVTNLVSDPVGSLPEMLAASVSLFASLPLQDYILLRPRALDVRDYRLVCSLLHDVIDRVKDASMIPVSSSPCLCLCP